MVLDARQVGRSHPELAGDEVGELAIAGAAHRGDDLVTRGWSGWGWACVCHDWFLAAQIGRCRVGAVVTASGRGALRASCRAHEHRHPEAASHGGSVTHVAGDDVADGDDYIHAVATYPKTLALSRRTKGAEESLALIRQRQYMDEPTPGTYVQVKKVRVTEAGRVSESTETNPEHDPALPRARCPG